MKNTVCIYATCESFNDEVDEINQELQESNIEFVKPQLGGGIPPENILEVFFVIANSFILSYAYDKTKAFILKCLDKHRKVSEEKGVKPVALKAMLTRTNASWTSADLFEHLKEEHAWMAVRRKQMTAGEEKTNES